MRINYKQWLEFLNLNSLKEFTTELDFSKFNFPDYQDKITENQKKNDLDEAVFTGIGLLDEQKIVVVIFEPNFLMGTLSYNVGKKIMHAIDIALKENVPLITITASGGARMQEGIFALMQMPVIQFGFNQLKEKEIQTINILSDPTMGGVSASFAFMADDVVAIKDAQIGFTGKMVIQQNFKDELPEDFQTAQKLYETKQIKNVIEASEIKTYLLRVLK